MIHYYLLPIMHFENELDHCVVDVADVDNINDATGTSERFSKSIWKNIVDIVPTVKSVIMMLATVNIIGTRISWPTTETKKNVYLGNLYDEVFSPVSEKTTEKKGSGKKHESKNTAEKIRRENEKKRTIDSFKKITEFFERIKKTTWDYKNFPSEIKMSAEHLAFFFTLALSHAKQFETSEENKYSLIHAILRFFNETEEEKINKTILTNLKTEFEEFKAKIKFMPEKFITTHSKLTVFNSFDSIFEGSSGFSPMEHQKEIVKHIVENYKDGFLLKYKVLAGYGKTTSIVPIAKISSLLNKKNRVVFCCNIDSVRQEVAKLLLHTGITFGIVAHSYWKKERDWYIKKHPSCKDEDSELQVLITGPEFANSVVKHLETKEFQVILFVDDFTVNADDAKSLNLKYNGNILSEPSKRIILASATFPDDEKMKDVYTLFKKLHPNANTSIPPITCEKIKIGCDLFTLTQCPITPFTGVKNINEMEKVKTSVLSNPFLKKFCTFSRVKEFNNEFAKHSFEKFDISSFASNFTNLNADMISNFFVDSLMTAKEYDDITEEEIMDIFSKKGGADKIEFNNLLNDWTTMFPGMTLIATPNPQKFLENFSGFISKIRKNFNLQKEIDIFDKKMENYEKLMVQKEKAIASSKEKKIVRDDNGNPEVQKQDGCIDAFESIERPIFKFPNFLKVNSKEHCDNICSKFNIPCDHYNNHHDNFPDGEENVDGKRLIDLNIDEDLILLLLSGIGVWSKTITSLEYKSLVLRFASNNMLTYVVADETICYGTNYPFNRVIITEEFSQIHSMETIFQVIARAGRLGLIYKAEAFIPESLLERLKEYSMSNVDSAFDEGKNIASTTLDSFFKKKSEHFAEECKIFETQIETFLEIKKNFFKSEKNSIASTVLKITKAQKEDKNENQKFDEWDEILDEIEKELPKETKTISSIKPSRQEIPQLGRQMFGSAFSQEESQSNKYIPPNKNQSQKYIPPSRR